MRMDHLKLRTLFWMRSKLAYFKASPTVLDLRTLNIFFREPEWFHKFPLSFHSDNFIAVVKCKCRCTKALLTGYLKIAWATQTAIHLQHGHAKNVLTLIQLWKKYSHMLKCGVHVDPDMDPDNDSCQTLFKVKAVQIIRASNALLWK